MLEICRVKNVNKYIEKNCASRWSFTKNHYMMHGQQNVKNLPHKFDTIKIWIVEIKMKIF